MTIRTGAPLAANFALDSLLQCHIERGEQDARQD
jgi:hypothetical protein